MPVARHPPYSPGRAVFPHPVLRLYSLPRCKAEPSGKPSPTWNLRNTRTRYLDAVEDVGKLLPRVAPLLASPPVEPFKRTVHRPMEEAVERARVPSHAIVVIVASQSRIQTLEECPPRQMPVLFDPFREPLASGLELLACGAPHDARHTVPIWCPEKLESQKGEAPLLAWVKTAEPAQMKLQAACQRLTEWIKQHRHLPGRAFFQRLHARLRGHDNYYGVRGNSASLNRFFNWAIDWTFKWPNRRGGKQRSYPIEHVTHDLQPVND